MNARSTTRSWKILTALFLLQLSGCSTTHEGSNKTIDRAPINLRQPCPKPEQLRSDRPLLVGDLVQADIDLANQYRECAKQIDGWIEWERGVVGRSRPQSSE